ncbi:MAG TPA: UDP-N-acetylglucosamine 2-epimerase [Pseudoxanthomonas sp.]|nr:UDP-N-acetylglucosamine 2-epimerase [Pseudoxanthomonas sp.]
MEHPRIIAASAIALAVTLFAIFALRPWARKVGLVDKPDLRKQHSGRVPLIGGICFFIGTLVGLGYLGYLDRFVMSLMMGSALIVAVGVADDVVNLSVRARLLTESAIVGLVILSTGYFVDNFGGLLPADHFRIGIIGIPLTIFAVIGLINAFNMLDGIDGLAASVAMVCIAAVLMYDRAGWAFVGVMFMLQILFAALIPYILVNLGWPDGRKVFMGDAGSTVIGFLLGWSLIYLSHSRVGRLAPVDVLWCVALPVMDTMAVMYRRIRLGRSPFGADRQHLHHLMVDAGLSPRVTLLLIVSGGALLALLGYVLRSAPDPLNLAAFLAATVLYVLGLPRLLELRKKGFVWRPSVAALRLRQPLAAHLGATAARGSLIPSGEDHEPYPHPTPSAAPVRALCVVAATPESFGVAPIAQRLNADARFDASVCLSDVPGVDGEAALKLFGLHAEGRLTGEGGAEAMAAGVRELFQQVKPDVVLVPGNAPASFALSLAAHAEDVPVVCVDSDSPAAARSQWPNDASRRIVQSLAALHIAASAGTGQRLLQEGVPAERVMVQDAISNQALHAGIQSLHEHPALGRSLDKRFPFLRQGHGLLLVLTAAVAEGAPGEERAANERAVAEAIEMIARRRPDLDIVWAMDALPPTSSQAEELRAFANVHLAEVSDYLAWIHLLDRAQLILAGPGVPCESRLLGKPVLLAREDGNEEGQDDRGCTVIGASPVTIAGRVLSVLSNEPEALNAMQVAASARSSDPGSGVLDALLRLHGGDGAAEGDHEPQPLAYGVRQAS